jgi:hypothetical protein
MPAKGECCYVKPNGTNCCAHPRDGSKYCYFHDPEVAVDRNAARRAGGRERSRKAAVLPTNTADQPLATAEDVLAMLTATANQVRRGEIAPKIAGNIGHLCAVALTAMKQAHFENCMRRLEEVVAVQDVSIDPEPVQFVREEDDEDYDDGEDQENGEADEDHADKAKPGKGGQQ